MQDRIRITGDLVAEIKTRVQLRDYAMAQGLSPISGHADRFYCPWRNGADSDGFQIFPDGWKDYVTEESGDAIEFVRKLRDCDFPTAVEELAAYANIDISPEPVFKKPENFPTETDENVSGKGKASNHISQKKPKITAVYKYCTDAKKLVFEVLRMEPGKHGKSKDFRQRRPDGKGGWIYNLKGLEDRPLYRLPEWSKEKNKPLFLVEGEKDVDNLFKLGLLATCNAGGAGKWKDSYSEALRGRRIVVIPDNDDAGKRHLEKVVPELWGKAESIRILELPNLPAKGDFSDWLENMEKLNIPLELIHNELLRLVDSCKEITEKTVNALCEQRENPQIETEQENPAKKKKNQNGKAPSAKCIADAFMRENTLKDMPLYRYYHGFWYRFKDVVYQKIELDDLRGDVMAFLRDHYPQNAVVTMRNNVIANLEASNVAAIFSLYPFPCWLPDGREAKEWLSMENCVINVDLAAARLGGEDILAKEFIREPDPALFSTFQVNYRFDPDAECPKFQKFIEEVQPTQAGRDIVQMMFGLMLVTECCYEVLFILHGEGGTGKSTTLNILREMVGNANTCCLPLHKINEKHSTHLLTENKVNIVGDMPYDAFLTMGQCEATLKDVTSGDNVAVEHKHRDPLKAKAIARCIFGTNGLPMFTDRSNGIWDRLRIIPFNQRFRNTPKQNPHLKDEIVKEELPGVFNWALKGLAMLKKLGHFPEHPEGMIISKIHRYHCDHERQFLEDSYEQRMESYALKKDLYEAYRNFCIDNGYRPKNAANFGVEVNRVFPEAIDDRTRIDGIQYRIWRNVGKLLP